MRSTVGRLIAVAEHNLTLDLIGRPAWSCSCETELDVARWHVCRTTDDAIDQWQRHIRPPELQAWQEHDLEQLRDRGLL